MPAKSLKPTASNVSKLLTAAHFQKSTEHASTIRGWKNTSNGFQCKKADAGCTVKYRTDDRTGTDEYRQARLMEYQAVLAPHFSTAIDVAEWGSLSLRVSAKEGVAP